jgi:hypothetical protein
LHEAEDLITHFVSTHALPYRIDDTGNITARGEGELWFKLVFTLNDEGVGKVDAAGLQADAYFFGAGLGNGDFFKD